MTTTADRLRTYWAERQVDRHQISSLAARYWEVALIASLMAVALGLRLWDLGGRAVHHDESIHMWYSWLLAEGRGYTHDPTYHGPFQIFGTAAIFKVFGDSDFIGRLAPALFGTALVGMPLFLRGFLGRTGAFIAVALLAFSPVLLYFSRFARNDIYIAVYTLGLAIIIWRYMKEQKEAYLFGIPLFLMLGFATKEVTFITTAIFLIYLEIQLARDLFDQIRASRELTPAETAVAYAALLPTAWLIAALWPLLEGPRRRVSLSSMPPSGHLMILFGTFALPQFSAAIQELPFIGQGEYMGETTLMRFTVLLAIAATAAVGLMWNPRVWAISAAIFYIPFFLLFTTFFTNGGDIWNPVNGAFWTGSGAGAGGFWTGIWGSLDYWLDQQLVRRGNQPDYYYFMFLPVYEFLPLIFALGGTLYYAFKGKLEHRLLAGSAVLLIFAFSIMPDDFPLLGDWHIHLAFITAIGVALLLPMESFTKFLVFWTLAVFYALTVAGEKMPWLAVHLAVPLALLAARVLDDICTPLVERIRSFASEPAQPVAESPPKGRPRRAEAHVAAPQPVAALHPAILLVAAAGLALVAALIFMFQGPASGLGIVAWLLTAGAAAAAMVAWRYVSWQLAGQVAAVSLVAALGVFTIRAGAIAIYDEGARGGTPPELLIYAQGAPDLNFILGEIEDEARVSGLGKELRIFHDNSVNDWPWPWYLRDYNYTYISSIQSYVPEPDTVALVSSSNATNLEPYMDKVQRSEEYRHMWWFPEFYRDLSPTGFLGDVFSGSFFSTWRGYFIDRTVPGANDPPDRVAYFFGDEPIEPVVTATPQVEGVISAERQTVIGGPGQEAGQFSQPADLTIGADGNLYLVDTLNQRIQKLGPNGRPLDAVGRAGSGEAEFANPRSDDYQIDDGPWGIEADRAGNVYVADTWNSRIQKFDADLKFVAEWGGDEGLFGPRDLAIDSEGNLLVVDTGMSRIVKYSRNGSLLEIYGEAGSGPGQFNEPTSVSVAANGDVYVADFWNKRIQRFDSSFTYLGEIAVDSWPTPQVTGVTDRAYIVALDDGTVLATDPVRGQVLVFGADGTWLGAWRFVPVETASRLVGITLDAESGQVYVSDGLGSQVRSFPLDDILVEPAPAATGSPTPTPTLPATP